MENCCSPHHLEKSCVNEQSSGNLQQCPVSPQLTRSVVAFVVWSSPVECLHQSSTSRTALRKTPLHCLASASWLSHTENKLLQSGQCFTLCLKQVHNHKLRVLVCEHNENPDIDSTLKCPITSVNTLFSSSACVPAAIVIGTFVILGNAHTFHNSLSSPTVSDAFLATSL